MVSFDLRSLSALICFPNSLETFGFPTALFIIYHLLDNF